MLSRVADNLYWMSRYIERAENTARLLDVNLQLLLDFENLDDKQLVNHWWPIICSSGDQERFSEQYGDANSRNVTEFLTFSRDNPNSIISCVNAARENARMVRDQISAEMWEVINALYHHLRAHSGDGIQIDQAWDFYDQLRNYSLLFQAHTESTFSHDQGYKFIQAGKFLERADQTSRIIDIKYHMLLPPGEEVGGVVDNAQWMAVLRSCSAFEAYHHTYVSDVRPWYVAEFLTLSPTFPRSIRFCISTLEYHLRSITRTPGGHFSNDVEQLTGRLRSEIAYTTIEEIINQGLHEYLDAIQSRVLTINEALFRTYVFEPEMDIDAEIAQFQQ